MRTHLRFLAPLGLALSLSLGMAGCSDDSGSDDSSAGSGDSDRDDLIGDIASQLDVEDSVAECFASAYEDVGISLEDVEAIGQGETPEGVDNQAFGEASTAALECLPEDQRGDLIDDSAAADPDAVRNGFITSFVATAPEGTTEEQAGCVFDELIDAGVELSEMSSSTLSPEVETALGEAVQTCGLG